MDAIDRERGGYGRLSRDLDDPGARARVEAAAREAARLFVEEFGEPLDSSATDWDSAAWAEDAKALRLDRVRMEYLWPVYRDTLEAETARLCREGDRADDEGAGDRRP